MINQNTFTKIITEKEYGEILQYLKSLPVPWQQLEPVANSLYRLPDAEANPKNDSKNKG